MNKTEYLAEIRHLLDEYRISREEMEDILNDYGQMWDDAVSQGFTDDEIRNKLGQPEKIVAELGESRSRRDDRRGRGKIVALMPFLCVAVYMGLGLSPLHLWHPGWMVFLLIPVTGILVGMKRRRDLNILTALSPFLAVAAFLILGFGWSLWHPGWLVFLIIPVVAILVSAKNRSALQTLAALSPFAAILAFFFLGQHGWWNPGWLVFLAIPMIGILNMKETGKMLGFELCFILAIAAYLYAGYEYGRWDYGGLAFALPVVYGILIGDIRVRVMGTKSLPVLLAALLAVLVYVASGILWPETFAWLWLVFFAVPVTAILTRTKRKDTLIALSPFLATAVFFLLGYFADAWAWSWLVFLLIPVTAILTGK